MEEECAKDGHMENVCAEDGYIEYECAEGEGVENECIEGERTEGHRARRHPSEQEALASDDDTMQWSLRAILPVAAIDAAFNPSEQPTCGEEYLRLVQHERGGMPRYAACEATLASSHVHTVAIESVEPSTSEAIRSRLSETAPALLPSAEWISAYLEHFDACFKYTHCCAGHDGIYDSSDGDVPAFGDEAAWKALLYAPFTRNASQSCRKKRVRLYGEQGSADGGAVEEEEVDAGSSTEQLRYFEPDELFGSIVLEQRQLMQLINFHLKWIEHDTMAVGERQYKWLVRILQSLDPRMTPRQFSLIRSLGMVCIELRAQLGRIGNDEWDREGRDSEEDKVGGESEGAEQASAEWQNERVFYLNGIIAIAARRFGQQDLLIT